MFTTVVVLMLRYIDLLAAEAEPDADGPDLPRRRFPRTLRQAGATARGVGGLFLRSYERGERVHLAMLSRGFTGRVPDLAVIGAPPKASATRRAIGLTRRRRRGGVCADGVA